MKFHTILFISFLIQITSFLLVHSSKPPFSCDSSNPSLKLYPFCRTTLPITQRAKDLVSRLTLDEKVSQLVDTSPAIPRLGIPAYEWWSEALHGVAFLPNVAERQGIRFNGSIKAATSFPQVILTASSFDPHLWYRIGQVNIFTQSLIFSDCDAVAIIHDQQGYAKEPEDAVADVLKAGMDVNCGDYLKNYTKSAVKKGKVAESEVDRALHNLFSIRMRLGLFNGDPSKLVYGNISADQVCSQEHQDLALEAARDGIVLLKNSDYLLPISKSKTTSLAIIGPNADVAKTLLGNYAGPPCKTVTPLEGLRSFVKNSMSLSGCNNVSCSSAKIDQAVKLAKRVDQVVLVMGLDQTEETEELDRVDLVLPGKQQRLISSVARAARKPVVLVLLCGGPLDVSFAKYDKKVKAILWAGYPGQAGGTALAEIIFGDHNPGGRLPMTWYPQKFTKVPMTDMRMRSEPRSGYPGRTYRFYKGEKVFEFGDGLSYSKYSYDFVSVSPSKLYPRTSRDLSMNSNPVTQKAVSELDGELCDKNRFTVTVRVENHGKMAGKHPVLLFVRQDKLVSGRPMKKLVGFQTMNVNAGERAEITYELSPCEHLSQANEDGLMVLEEGSHYLFVGDKEYPITVSI